MAVKNFKTTLIICGGTGCQASRSRDVIDAVKKELAKQGLDKTVHVRSTGCHGFCEQGPLCVIEPGNIFYCHLTTEDAEEIVTETIQNGRAVKRLLYTDPVSKKVVKTESEIPFYRAQNRHLISQNQQVDPCSIDDYIAIGGYSALAKTLFNITPDGVIKEIVDSGLRGRGGGGFPTGRKWPECREAPGDEKYVICNADEGRPRRIYGPVCPGRQPPSGPGRNDDRRMGRRGGIRVISTSARNTLWQSSMSRLAVQQARELRLPRRQHLGIILFL